MQTEMFKETAADLKFIEFNEKNPQVYLKLVELTIGLRQQGRKRIGMQMLFEVIRWQTMMTTTDADYKINNNYRSRYSRKIMAEYPEFDGMFEIREMKS